MQSILKFFISISTLLFLLGAAGVSSDINLSWSKLMVGLGFGVWLFIVSNFIIKKGKNIYGWVPILILIALCFFLLVFIGVEARLNGKVLSNVNL